MRVPEAENLCAPVERRRSVKNRRLASEEWKDDGRRKPNTHNEEKRSLRVSQPDRRVNFASLSWLPLLLLLLLLRLWRRHDHSRTRYASRRGRRIRLLRLRCLLRLRLLHRNRRRTRCAARSSDSRAVVRRIARVIRGRRCTGLVVFDRLTIRTDEPRHARPLRYPLWLNLRCCGRGLRSWSLR